MNRFFTPEAPIAISDFVQKSDTYRPGVNPGLPARVRAALALDIRECPLKRPEIAARLSAEVGRAISMASLDAMVAETKVGYRFPAELIPAWAKVTGSRRLIGLLAAEMRRRKLARVLGDRV